MLAFKTAATFFPPGICQGTATHDNPGLIMPTIAAYTDGFFLGELVPVETDVPSTFFKRGLSDLKEGEQLGVYIFSADALSFHGLCSFGGFRPFDTSVSFELSKGSNLLAFSLIATASGKRLLLTKSDASNPIWLLEPR